MTTAIAASSTPSAITPEVLRLVRDTVFPDATDAELQLFAHDCARQNVHPLDRLIHPQVRKDKNGNRRYVAVTSIDLMRSRAGDTGEHMGTDDAEYGTCRDRNGNVVDSGSPEAVPETARVTVYRMVSGQRVAFSATARWLEYVPEAPSDRMWRKMPFLMLAKCAEALALRKAFPRTLAGLYEQSEMAQAGDPMAADAVVRNAEPSKPALPAKAKAKAPARVVTPERKAAESRIGDALKDFETGDKARAVIEQMGHKGKSLYSLSDAEIVALDEAVAALFAQQGQPS